MTYNEFLAEEVERLRATCDDLENNLHYDLAERDLEEAAGQHASQLRTFRSLVQDRVRSAQSQWARAVTAKASPALMRELAEEIRRLDAIQAEIDKRLTPH